MKKHTILLSKLAMFCVMVLQGVLLFSANSTSCILAYEEPAPQNLKKFSRVK